MNPTSFTKNTPLLFPKTTCRTISRCNNTLIGVTSLGFALQSCTAIFRWIKKKPINRSARQARIGIKVYVRSFNLRNNTSLSPSSTRHWILFQRHPSLVSLRLLLNVCFRTLSFSALLHSSPYFLCFLAEPNVHIRKKKITPAVMPVDSLGNTEACNTHTHIPAL